MTTLTLDASPVLRPSWRDTVGTVSTRRAATAVVGSALVGWLIWQLSQSTTLTLPRVTSWTWASVAVVACAASFAAGAAVLVSVAPVRVPLVVAFGGQVAAAATKLVTPASLGIVGLNARLLQTHGSSLPHALAAVGASQVAQFALTLGALAVILPMADVALAVPAPSPTVVWAVAGVFALAIPVAAAIGRRHLAGLGPRILAAVRPLKAILRTPWRTMVLALGSTALTAALTLSLWASVKALGGSASVVTVGVVLLVGSALGSAVPTPGGVGGVEGAMVGAFVATGLGAEVALPAVLLFRFVTFWLPVPLGAAALLCLRRSGHL